MSAHLGHNDHCCYGGWIYEFGDGAPKAVGRCEPCALQQLADQTGRAKCTWETWEEIPALTEPIRSLRDWRGETWSMLLHAAPAQANFGSGKSHASSATAGQWIKDGRDVRYFCASDVVYLHRQALFHSGIRLPALEDFSGLVVFDDLGSETRTDWTRELIDRLFDQRYRRSLPTLVTTNLDLAAIEERYPRLRSRFCEGLQLVWAAPDFRRRHER